MSDCQHEKLIHTTFETPSKGKHPYVFHVIRCKDCNQLLGVSPVDSGTSMLQIMTNGFSEIMKAIGALEKAFTRK
jgi:hypothetical protein